MTTEELNTQLYEKMFGEQEKYRQWLLTQPPDDVPVLIREVRRVGYNIDQLLKIANAKGLLDVPQLRKALADNRAVEKMIMEAYTMSGD